MTKRFIDRVDKVLSDYAVGNYRPSSLKLEEDATEVKLKISDREPEKFAALKDIFIHAGFKTTTNTKGNTHILTINKDEASLQKLENEAKQLAHETPVNSARGIMEYNGSITNEKPVPGPRR